MHFITRVLSGLNEIKVKKQAKPVNIHLLMNDFCLVVFELKIYANNTAFDPHGLSCVEVD